jgi:hypothetical protein
MKIYIVRTEGYGAGNGDGNVYYRENERDQAMLDVKDGGEGTVYLEELDLDTMKSRTICSCTDGEFLFEPVHQP